MSEVQDPKYDFRDGMIVNRETGEPIPPDEPVFVLRAKDKFARIALQAYALEVPQSEVQDVASRIEAFKLFRQKFPSRCKE